MSRSSHYRTPPSSLQPSIGVIGVFSRAVDAVRADTRTVAVTFLGNLFGIIPFIGVLSAALGYGIAVRMARKTFEEAERPENALPDRLIYLVAATLVAIILIGVGLSLLVLPGIYLTVRFALYPAAVMSDDQGPLGGLSESWNRTGGHSWTVFGFLLVVLFLMGVTAVAVIRISIIFDGNIVGLLVAVVITAPFTALNAGGIAVMYDEFED